MNGGGMNGDAGLSWRRCTRFTIEVHDRFSKQVVKAAHNAGIFSLDIRPGRIVQLEEKERRFSMLRFSSLVESPGEVISFITPPDSELDILCSIVRETRLDMPGRGTLYTEPVEVIGEDGGFRVGEGGIPGTAVPGGILTRLSGIVFIVPKGLGNAVAETALELGTCVPVVTYGTGTGLRDKIGLLRVTIPAEKEVVHLVTPDHDAEGITALIIEELRLNQPGKGFVYSYPIGSGLLNTRLRVGEQHHAATIEQIIAAIDGLRYGTDWRRRFAGEERMLPGGGRYVRGLTSFSMICNEESTYRLTRAAMAAGSGGATSTRIRTVNSTQPSGGTRVREMTTMIIREDLVDRVAEAVRAEGLFEPDTEGRIELDSCPFAYAYSGSRRRIA